MKKNIILTIAVSLIGSIVVIAQPKFEEGWVAITSGDTLYGKLKVFDKFRSCSKVYFLDVQGKRTRLKYRDIAAYQRGEELYVSRPRVRPICIGCGPNELMRVLHIGPKVTLYEYHFINNIGGGPGQVSIDGSGSDYYIEWHGRTQLVYKSKFKDTMSTYFSDDRALSQKIKEKIYKYADMERIVKEYDQENTTDSTNR